MPRQKKIPDDAVRTTAQIPAALHSSISQELPLLGRNFTLAEAINDGLVLWLASRQGDQYIKRQLAELLESLRPQYYETPAKAAAKSSRRVGSR